LRDRQGKEEMVRIAILGDSLTEGWPGAAYFPLLERLLPQHELLNHGRAGDTVADLLSRMRGGRLAAVDLAVVWIGVNDAVMDIWDATTPKSGSGWEERLERLRGDYEALLDWTAARAGELLLVRPLVLEAEGSLWEARAAELGDVIDELGAARGAELIDLAPAFAAAQAAGDGPFTIDGVHFTDAGARVVAAAFAAAVAHAG
jgi:lysophospholipase L1-like esterase